MSWPSNRMRPELGASSPVSWPISVVLPAPFGPMIACSSPRGTSSEIWSEATTPPKRFVSPSICSNGSATASLHPVGRREMRERQGLEQAVDAAARKQHHQQQQWTENDLPILGDAGQRLLQHEQRDRPDQRTE